jgi:antagonist of KipI
VSGSIRVRGPGLLTTVQDLGRFGYGDLGVSAAGAADALSLRIGNRLVGNDQGAAALEMTLVGGTFAFEAAAVIALTGSDFDARLDGARLAPWARVDVKPGTELRLGASRGGARAYLCVRGGIDVPPVLGSASTHLVAGLGGLEGRALRVGDRLAIGGRVVSDPRPGPFDPLAVPGLSTRDVLRVTPGPQADWFTDAARETFHTAYYRIAESSDRMGLRLEGPPLEPAIRADLLTEGVCLGAVQVPADLRPIVLFVEHQTTGGYPKIANVISADFHALGQLRPRDSVRFEPVSLQAALALLRAQEEAFHALLD